MTKKAVPEALTNFDEEYSSNSSDCGKFLSPEVSPTDDKSLRTTSSGNSPFGDDFFKSFRKITYQSECFHKIREKLKHIKSEDNDIVDNLKEMCRFMEEVESAVTTMQMYLSSLDYNRRKLECTRNKMIRFITEIQSELDKVEEYDRLLNH